MEELKNLSAEEAVQLAAVDNAFFSNYYFPKTFRQASPEFHTEIWEEFEGPERYVGLMIFRDGAKTTLARACIAKRISYATSRTMLIVGKSEGAAKKSLQWLKTQITFNTLWTTHFGLTQGEIWNDSHCIVNSSVMGVSIHILATGIEGSIRGLNLEDYRPDFILVDDPCDESNTLTPEGREKLSELFYGGVVNTLAPETENPEAKIVLLQTPIHEDDLISQAEKDSMWRVVKFSILSPEGESTWPERYPTATVLKQKAAFEKRNQLDLWLREKEMVVVNPKNSYFKVEWLQYYDTLPEDCVFYLGLDPTPPPKNLQALQKETKSKKSLDDAVLMVVAVSKHNIYLVEYWDGKSPQPDELVNKFFDFRRRYRPVLFCPETHLGQRTLVHLIETEMRKRGEFTRIEPIEDMRPKPVRITHEISEVASSGRLFVKHSHGKFLEQYRLYPMCKHDDHLDALTHILIGRKACPGLEYGQTFEGEYERLDDETKFLLENWRR